MFVRTALAAFLAIAASPALALDAGFSEGPDDAVTHKASGFICPQRIGIFERDAAGLRDPDAGSDFCTYSALSGVYGTIVLTPLSKTYDPKALLAPDFAVQEGTGAKVIDETVQSAGPANAVTQVYMRTYENARLESLHYRTLFADAPVGNWSVAVILEYAFPRDREVQTGFLNSVYSAAIRDIAIPPP